MDINQYWNDNDEENLKEAVKAELDSMETSPSQEDWNKVASGLKIEIRDKNAAPKKSLFARIRPLNAAAVLLVLIGGGVWFAHIFSEHYNMTSPESTGLSMEEASVEYDLFALDTEDSIISSQDSVSEMTSDGIVPEKAGGFKLDSVTESPHNTVYYIYKDGDKELWHIRAAVQAGEIKDVTRINDDRFIPADHLTGLDTGIDNLVEDNTGNPVLIWYKDEQIFMLWSCSGNITGDELLNMRQYWP